MQIDFERQWRVNEHDYAGSFAQLIMTAESLDEWEQLLQLRDKVMNVEADVGFWLDEKQRQLGFDLALEGLSHAS